MYSVFIPFAPLTARLLSVKLSENVLVPFIAFVQTRCPYFISISLMKRRFQQRFIKIYQLSQPLSREEICGCQEEQINLYYSHVFQKGCNNRTVINHGNAFQEKASDPPGDQKSDLCFQ